MVHLTYKTKQQLESIGSVQLNIECLDDLNATIDQVFKVLEGQGNPQALEELCPYFGVIWPAARGLSEYLSQLPTSSLLGTQVLELGCGLALPSMVTAKRGAQTLATDFHPEVPKFLEKNILNNQLTHLKYQWVNWEKDAPQLGPFDWVIGSDILYERRYPEPLARTIAKQVKPNGKIILADPGRPYLQGFVDAMKSLGFQCTTKIFRVPNPPTFQEVFVLIFDTPNI
jgi:predicted nicotinamide N-methyase